MRYLINLSFDGHMFYGSQKQKEKRTVENELETVLSKILNTKIKLVSSSRTDKGVHALDFYFHFDLDKEVDTDKLTYSTNKLLPSDIYVNNIKVVNNDFHARYSVIDKEYKYIINENTYDPIKNNYLYNYCKKIDINLLKEASKHLIGEKDFRTFTSDKEKENTVRNIKYIKIEEQNGVVTIYISADGFLRYMVRNIVGFLLDINEGKIKIEDIDKILESKDRTLIGKPASSAGLYLNKVNY